MSKKITALAFGLALCAGGCKQGVGERCQIDSDCEQGLECNASTQECQPAGTVTTDAPPDQQEDAATDGPPAIDASSTDAPVEDAPAPDAAEDAADGDAMM